MGIRLSFAQLHISRSTPWKQLIFSDETWFELGTNNHYIWRIPGKVYPGTTRIADAHPQKVMIWGAIGFNSKSQLVIFTQNVTGDVYINQAILGSNLIYDADAHFGIDQWALVQDNARPHVSNDVLQTLDELDIILIDWPPYSPDLNPIETILAVMKRMVQKFPCTTISQLKLVVHMVWNSLSWSKSTTY